MTLTLRTVGLNEKGKVIGLRSTANRITAIGAPFLMGAIAQLITEATGDKAFGLELSFYATGGLACLLMGLIAWRMTKHPQIHELADRGRAGP